MTTSQNNDVKKMANMYALRMTTEMLKEFFDFTSGPNYSLDISNTWNPEIEMLVFKNQIKAMHVVYQVIEDDLTDKLDEFGKQLTHLAEESIAAYQIQDEDVSSKKLDELKDKAMKLEDKTDDEIEALA